MGQYGRPSQQQLGFLLIYILEKKLHTFICCFEVAVRLMVVYIWNKSHLKYCYSVTISETAETSRTQKEYKWPVCVIRDYDVVV